MERKKALRRERETARKNYVNKHKSNWKLDGFLGIHQQKWTDELNGQILARSHRFACIYILLLLLCMCKCAWACASVCVWISRSYRTNLMCVWTSRVKSNSVYRKFIIRINKTKRSNETAASNINLCTYDQSTHTHTRSLKHKHTNWLLFSFLSRCGCVFIILACRSFFSRVNWRFIYLFSLFYFISFSITFLLIFSSSLWDWRFSASFCLKIFQFMRDFLCHLREIFIFI